MALIEINRNPSQRELKLFGVVVLAFCGIVGLVLRDRIGWHVAGAAIWALGTVFVIVYYAAPPIRRSLYVGWSLFFFPLGFVLSHVVLGIVYYLVITPIGLMMRLFGRDALRGKIDRGADSYWERRPPVKDPESYFRQF